MLMRAVNCFLQLVFKLEIKKNAEQSKAKKFSKIYCLCVKNGHSECIFFRTKGGHGPLGPLGPPRSASVTHTMYVIFRV